MQTVSRSLFGVLNEHLVWTSFQMLKGGHHPPFFISPIYIFEITL